MDIKMPVMDGLEATKVIRTFNEEIVIIALTANAYDSDREKAYLAGCNNYMAKPVMAAKLREWYIHIWGNHTALRTFPKYRHFCFSYEIEKAFNDIYIHEQKVIRNIEQFVFYWFCG